VEQPVKAEPLRLQANVADSSATKMKVALVDVDEPAGPPKIVVRGLWMSTIQGASAESDRATFRRPPLATPPSKAGFM
jgi:hypothetical protein